jgi:hypothetical protein
MTATDMEIEMNPTAIMTAIGGVATTVLAWTQGQRQAKGSHLDNVDKAIKIWQDLAEKQTAKMESLEATTARLMAEHDECAGLRVEVCALREDVANCEKKHSKVETEIEQWKEFVRKGVGFPDNPNRGKE